METGFIDQGSVETSIAYNGYGNGATYPLLRTESKGVGYDPPLLGCDLVTLPNGSVSGALYSYGAGGQLTDKKEYDYGVLPSGSTCQNLPSAPTPTRETKTTYQSFAAIPLFPSGPSIFDRPSAVQVYAGSTLMAETDYAYDGYGTNGITPVTATGHDNTYYLPSYTNDFAILIWPTRAQPIWPTFTR